MCKGDQTTYGLGGLEYVEILLLGWEIKGLLEWLLDFPILPSPRNIDA